MSAVDDTRPSGQSPAVLVVEDEFVIRKAVADELTGAGFTVHEAGDYNEAVTVLATSGGIDLVLTDIAMPGRLNGDDLIRLIRVQHTHIIVVAATATNAYGPVDGLLRKPYDPAEAVVLVHRLLKTAG